MLESHRVCTVLLTLILSGACSSHSHRSEGGANADGTGFGPDATAGTAGVGGGSVRDGSPLEASAQAPEARDAAFEPSDALKPDLPASVPDVGQSDAVKTTFDSSIASEAKPGPDSAVADSPLTGGDSRTREAGSTVFDADDGTNEMIRICALAASCAGMGSPFSTTRCIQELGKTASRQDDSRLNHLLSCSHSATCDDFRRCWGGDLFTLDTMVTNASCKGDILTLRTASGSSLLQLDCSVLGGTCADPMTDVQRALCNPVSCASGSQATCDGAKASGCGNSIMYTSRDCARSGLACQIKADTPTCVGSGETCASTEKVTCSGSVATYCSGGARAKVDCAGNSLASRCAEGASSGEPCAPAGSECDPTKFADRCEENMLKVCANGFITSVACESFTGLRLCWAPTTDYARCEPGVH